MDLQVSIIGPTNLVTFGEDLGGVSQETLLEWANFVGRTLAGHGCGLLTNPGEGMLAAVAASYKKYGGTAWTMVLPGEAYPWPNYHALAYKGRADADRVERDWNDANHRAVDLAELCICLGLSGGTSGEISKAIYDIRFQRGNLKKLVVVRALIESGRLRRFEERELGSRLVYLDNREDLPRIIGELQ